VNYQQKTLTRRQQEIYQHLLEHFSDNDYAPTLDELCQSLKLKSRGSLHKHIQALIEADLLLPLNGKQRGVQLNHLTKQDENHLPFLGKIAAGLPIEAIENPETLPVPACLRSNRPCFVLQVTGDSMIDAGILDGDFVIIEKAETANIGDIIVALIDENEVTLKRFDKKNNSVILHPENTSMQALKYAAQRVRIQGKLIAQMRSYMGQLT